MIYSVFQEHPYLSRLLLGLISVIGVAEVVIAGTGVFTRMHDWILGCLLLATTLAWAGAAALTGTVAPVGNTAMKYAYGVLLVFPLILLVYMTADLILYQEFFDTEPDWLPRSVRLTFWVWMALAGLVGSLTPHNIDARAYVPLIIAPLLVGVGVMVVLAFLLLMLMGSALIPGADWVRWESGGLSLLGLYGLATFLLFRGFLVRFTWIRRLRVNVSLIALGITMASYCVIAILTFRVGVELLYWYASWTLFVPLPAGIIISIPVGSLISEMRHPYRNVLVAAIGPGLLMLMIMCFYWFSSLQKGI